MPFFADLRISGPLFCFFWRIIPTLTGSGEPVRVGDGAEKNEVSESNGSCDKGDIEMPSAPCPCSCRAMCRDGQVSQEGESRQRPLMMNRDPASSWNIFVSSASPATIMGRAAPSRKMKAGSPLIVPSPQPSPTGRGRERALRDFHSKTNLWHLHIQLSTIRYQSVTASCRRAEEPVRVNQYE